MVERFEQASAETAEIKAGEKPPQVTATITGTGQVSSRSKVLQVRLSPEEFEAVERAAEQRGLPASTVARERLLKMLREDAAPEWTRAQQVNALKAVDIVRAVLSSADPAENIMAATLELAKLIPGGVDATDAAFAEAGPDIITGLVNVAGTMAEHAAARSGLSVEQVLADVIEGVRSVKIVG